MLFIFDPIFQHLKLFNVWTLKTFLCKIVTIEQLEQFYQFEQFHQLKAPDETNETGETVEAVETSKLLGCRTGQTV